MGFQFIVY